MLPMVIKCVSLDFTKQTERQLSKVSFLIPLTMFLTNSGTQAVADDGKSNPSNQFTKCINQYRTQSSFEMTRDLSIQYTVCIDISEYYRNIEKISSIRLSEF